MTYEEKKNTIEGMFSVLDPDLEITVDFYDDGEKVFINFPREDGDIEYDFDDLLKLKSLVLTDTERGRVCTSHITQFPILGHEYHAAELFTETKRLEYSNAGTEIKIVRNPLIIGLGAVVLGEYSKYCPPCSPYLALQITYSDTELRPTLEEEYNLAKAFLFQQSYLADISIPFSEINDIYYGWDDEDDDETLNELTEIEELTTYTPGMDLFTRALESVDSEIRYLFYYKIIEYYAPIVAKRIANERITIKLDAIRLKRATSKDIDAILAISNQYKTSQSDKELAQSVLKAAVDIVDIFPKLPEEIRKKISKEVGFSQTALTHETNSQIKDKIIDALGKVLYSTRNSIVHAKSNYTSDNAECSLNDLPEFNRCLKDITYSIINWYDRLPEHIKYQS